MNDIAPGFVRVHNQAGGVAGSGYVAVGNHVCTCAHVCAHAIGDPKFKESRTAPTQLLSISLPFFSQERYQARIMEWSPDIPGGTDAALLEVLEPLPSGCDPLPIVSAVDATGAPVEVHGYQTGTSFDVHAEGCVGASNAQGWFELIGKGSHGFFVQPGFSGGPVWDISQQAAIGMIKAVAADPLIRVAFLIPNDTLCSKLQNYRLSGPDDGPLTFDKQRADQFAKAAQFHPSARDRIAVNLRDLSRRNADPTQRYWIYLTLREVGGESSQRALRDALERETNAFARRGLDEALRS
jgi:hypothetical protein